MKGGHVEMPCNDPDCGGTCFACTLSWCRVCGGAEGSLSSECPGRQLTQKEADAIYAKTLDYINGTWIVEAAVDDM